MRAELLKAKEERRREIQRLGKRALRERQPEEFIKERLTLEAREKILDSLTADQLESMGKTFTRRSRKEQSRADACFILAKARRRRTANDADRL